MPAGTVVEVAGSVVEVGRIVVDAGAGDERVVVDGEAVDDGVIFRSGEVVAMVCAGPASVETGLDVGVTEAPTVDDVEGAPR